MAEKKYYWLKLKEDYFRTKEIKKLRKIAGGDTFTIIYLKMQLISLKNEGVLIYEGIEENFSKELALELDEEEENVKLTLAFLQANGMIEQKSNYEFFLNRVPETLASETDAAKRMRISRQKRNIVTDSYNKLHYIDIEKEIEQEKEIEINNIINKEKILEKKSKNKSNSDKEKKHKYGEYKNVLLSDIELEKLKNEFPIDWKHRIETVSEYCASKGKSYVNYLATIRNWAKKEKKGSDISGKYGNNIKFNIPKSKIISGTKDLDEEIRNLGLL